MAGDRNTQAGLMSCPSNRPHLTAHCQHETTKPCGLANFDVMHVAHALLLHTYKDKVMWKQARRWMQGCVAHVKGDERRAGCSTAPVGMQAGLGRGSAGSTFAKE